MRVCFVADVGTKISGGHQSLLNLMTDLKKYGVEPYLGCHKDWELVKKVREMGIPTKVVPGKIYTANKDKITPAHYLKYPLKRLYNFVHLSEIKKYLTENKIELVHLNSVLSSEAWARAAYECNIPYVWHIREFMEQDHGRIIINSSYSYKWLKKAKNIITISKAVQAHWEKVLGRHCDVVYNGLPFEKYGGNTAEKFKSNEIRCVIVGRITEGKGQMDAVRAVEYMKSKGIDNISLTLVGYRDLTDYEKQTAKYIEDNGLSNQIKLVDFTYDLSGIRKQHDIGITSSNAEAFGRVTIENMMSGMLAVGTDSGGTPELIENGETGFLYKPGDYRALADILTEAVRNPEKMGAIAAKGQEDAKKRFLIERTVASVYEIYCNVLGVDNKERQS
jgi:hypothetical protein